MLLEHSTTFAILFTLRELLTPTSNDLEIFFSIGIMKSNAFVSRALVVVDFCAKMAEGHAQKGTKTKTSAGQIC